MKKIIFCFLIVCSSFKVYSVISPIHKPIEGDTISLLEFWSYLLENTNIESKTLTNIYVKDIKASEKQELDSLLSTSRIVEHSIHAKNIYLIEPTTIYRSHYSNVKNIIFKKNVSIKTSENGRFNISNCRFEEGLILEGSGTSECIIDSISVNKVFWVFWDSYDTKISRFIQIKNSTFDLDTGNNFIAGKGAMSITVSNSKFFSTKSLDGADLQLIIDADVNQLSLFKNEFDLYLYFGVSSKIEESVHLNENKFKFADFTSFTPPENPYQVRANWGSLRNSIGMQEWSGDKQFHFIQSDSSFKNQEIYKVIRGSVHQWYVIFKSQGNLEDANRCYMDLKVLETHRWKYLFEQNKTFESFFRWQLNSFLSYFTDYGTNPVKAVIKSAWVILLFAIFYLFFPSDWDVSNRSQLLSKVKDLTSKNREKSFIATLAFVAYSAFIHILNALTLSLNAFTTLGFGDIPTHGAARYVTIVQGFIGWFLLTIFSVSLINQVLG